MVFPFSSIPAPTGSTPSSNRPSSKVFPLIRCPFENSTLLFASHRIILPFPFADLRRRSCKLSNLLHLRRCGQHSSSISFKELLLWWTACLYAHYILYCLLYIHTACVPTRQAKALSRPKEPQQPPPRKEKKSCCRLLQLGLLRLFLSPHVELQETRYSTSPVLSPPLAIDHFIP